MGNKQSSIQSSYIELNSSINLDKNKQNIIHNYLSYLSKIEIYHIKKELQQINTDTSRLILLYMS